MWMFFLGSFAYLAVGRLLGKWFNFVWFNNTPSKNLGVFQKASRLVCFPVAYHNWGAYASSTPEKDETYCRIMMFLWPFKLLSAIVGLIEILWLSGGAIVGAIGFSMSCMFDWNRARNLIADSRKAKAMEQLQARQDDFHAQYQRLAGLREELNGKLQALRGGIDHGNKLAEEFAEGSSGHDRVVSLVARLNEKHDTVLAESARIGHALDIFGEKKKEIAASMELLKLYFQVREFDADDMDALASEVRAAIVETLRSCAELYRHVYDAERGMMLQIGSVVEDIADQIVEGEERVERMEPDREAPILLA